MIVIVIVIVILFHLILFQVIVGTKQDVDRVDLPYEEIEATVTF